MSEYVIPAVTAILMLLGAIIALISAIGLLRLPDLFTRMHAASKAATAASGLALIAGALESQDVTIWVKCIATIGFLLVTAPVSAHLLAKAALKAGYPVTDLDDKRKP